MALPCGADEDAGSLFAMLNCYIPRRATPQELGKSSDDSQATEGRRTLSANPRGDGRGALDLRRVFMEVGVVKQAAGSAYVECNHTKVSRFLLRVYLNRRACPSEVSCLPRRRSEFAHAVPRGPVPRPPLEWKVLCVVHGPHTQSSGDSMYSEEGRLRCDFRYAPFAQPTGRHDFRGQGDDERDLSALLQQTLVASVQVQRLTKSVVDVHCMVMQADGGELGVAACCASMALANAGIELFDLVAACSVGCLGSEVVLDPTWEEETGGSGTMMLATMQSTQQVTQWWQRGRLDAQTAAQALEFCTDGCTTMHAMMQTTLASSLDGQ